MCSLFSYLRNKRKKIIVRESNLMTREQIANKKENNRKKKRVNINFGKNSFFIFLCVCVSLSHRIRVIEETNKKSRKNKEEKSLSVHKSLLLI